MDFYNPHADDRGPWFIYLIYEKGSAGIGPVKVGTANNVTYRVDGQRGGNWRDLIIHSSFEFRDRGTALVVDREIKQRFAQFRVGRRDWFLCTPAEIAAYLTARTTQRARTIHTG